MIYRVTNCNTKIVLTANQSRNVRELMDQFGLHPFYSKLEVFILWDNFSGSQSAGWLFPHPDYVSTVFGVTLEKVI